MRGLVWLGPKVTDGARPHRVDHRAQCDDRPYPLGSVTGHSERPRDERESGNVRQKSDDRVTTDSDGDVGTVSRTLDGWRARIDELLVQIDLGGHDVRDRVRKEIDLTENAYLAARSRLSDVPADVHADITTVMEDLQRAFQAAEAAFHRGRSN